MMFLKSRASSTLVAIGLGFSCTCSNAAIPLKTLGFDDMSCKAWSDSKSEPDQRSLYVTWIRGLLTGYNYARPSQQVSEISDGTVENFVNRYCFDHPVGSFLDAALRLSDQYSGRNSPITK